jgi:HD-GYP domain-containing protein (c-di-GMP phosphodiesterase class II)
VLRLRCNLVGTNRTSADVHHVDFGRSASEMGALAGHLSALAHAGDPGEVGDALCTAAVELLDLDAARLIHPGEEPGPWARRRPAAPPPRVPLARLEAMADAARAAGDVVVGRTRNGRVLAVPVDPQAGEGSVVLVGVIRGTAPVGDGVGELAAALAIQAAARWQAIDEQKAPQIGGMLDGVAGQTELDIAPRVDQFELLQSLSAALAGVRTEHEVGQAVVHELRRIVEYGACRFYTLAPDGDTLLPIVQVGLEDAYADDRPEDLIVHVGEGITGRVFADGEAIRFDDAGAVAWAVDVPGDPVVEESMLAAPLMTQEGAIGVVVVSKVGIGQFSDDDLKVLKLVAALATVAVESARNQAEQREAAEVSEALLELAAALSLQSSVDGIARMVALALDRLMQSAGISVWLRDGDDLVPAALVGYTPREDQRLMRLRLPASAEPLGPALLSRRVMVLNVDEAPVLAGCLDAAPAGTTFALIAVGEHSANRGLIVVQRGPRRGPPALRDERMLLGIADQALLAVANRALYDELETSFLATVEALGNALDLKDSYTNDHAQALVGMCTAVAERMGLPDADVRDVSFASALHDIGKIGIPIEILNKPARLTVEEFEVMKRHPELGGRIIAPVPALAGARELVVACHEHFDGSGYPLGLAGEEIPVGARIILACDAYHAMVSDRVYRKAMSSREAVAELRRCAGGQFDAEVVDSLVAVISAMEAAVAAER